MMRFKPTELTEYKVATKQISLMRIKHGFQHELFPSYTDVQKYNKINALEP